MIDTHTHFYDPSRPQGVPWPPKENKLLYRTVLPEHFRAVAEPHGVTGTVVVEASRRLEDNQWILDLAANDPTIVGFVGGLVPNRPAFQAELRRFAANPLFRGIRCGGAVFQDLPDALLADLSTLAERDLALDLLIHAQELDSALEVARRLPDLRLVINHILHMPVDGKALDPSWLERYQRAADLPNVFMKVSAMMEQSTVEPAPAELDFYRPTLDALWLAFGQDRLIYGSNWPVCERAGTYATYFNVVNGYFQEKGAEAREKYFQKNASLVYKWVDRGRG